MNAYLLLAIAIAAEIIGTTAMKAAHGFTKPLPSILVVCGYGIAFWMMSLTLKALPVSIVYAIWSGIGIAATAVIGVVLFREHLGFWQLGGLALIITGAVVLSATTPSGAP